MLERVEKVADRICDAVWNFLFEEHPIVAVLGLLGIMSIPIFGCNLEGGASLAGALITTAFVAVTSFVIYILFGLAIEGRWDGLWQQVN